MPESGYGTADKVIHRLALGSKFVQRVAFDLDCAVSKNLAGATHPAAPVYVAGLARSGTTLILKALYSTGDFSSLTYRCMPFVTAPYLWTRLSAKHRTEGSFRERAHGDGILVDFDSPEAFEEVIWGLLTESGYVSNDGLRPHSADELSLNEYRRFVSSVVAAGGDNRRRYLAKNNNNLLRLDSLLSAFPDATILVPFRHPQKHAESLLRQHKRFLARHAEEPFSLQYMNWLGHFEFGANLKPFLVGSARPPRRAEEALCLDYWLEYWDAVYRHILVKFEDKVVLLDYDELCREPRELFSRLSDAVSVQEAHLLSFAEQVRTDAAEGSAGPSLNLSRVTHDTYASLLASAL